MTAPYRTPGGRDGTIADLISTEVTKALDAIYSAEFDFATRLVEQGHKCIEVHRDVTRGWIQYGDGIPTARIITARVNSFEELGEGTTIRFSTHAEVRGPSGKWEIAP